MGDAETKTKGKEKRQDKVKMEQKQNERIDLDYLLPAVRWSHNFSGHEERMKAHRKRVSAGMAEERKHSEKVKRKMSKAHKKKK